jgi:hypothetical protein
MSTDPEPPLLPPLVRKPLNPDDEPLHREAMRAGHAAMAVFDAETLAAMERFARYVDRD